MKATCLLLPAILLLSLAAFGQDDWQHFKPQGNFSFQELKDAVHRITADQIYDGWDEKKLVRAGDLVSLAILQTVSDSQMTAPATLKGLLYIIRQGFFCPSRCVAVPSDRQPKITMLLLEHLHNNTSGNAQSDVDETREFVLQHASGE